MTVKQQWSDQQLRRVTQDRQPAVARSMTVGTLIGKQLNANMPGRLTSSNTGTAGEHMPKLGVGMPPDAGETETLEVACPICGTVSGKRTVPATLADMRKAELTRALCNKPRCRWETLEAAQQIARAVKAGVGRQYIRTAAGRMPGKGDQAVVPILERFPAIVAGKLKEVDHRQSTFICGTVNTGKSWLLCCLAVEAIAEGRRVEIVNWSRFKRQVRSSYQPGARQTEQDIFDRYDRVEVLCVDDLGVGIGAEGKETKAATEMLYDLIDQRYWSGRPTHITSNLNPDSLESHYDQRIARRISQLCRVVVLHDLIDM